MFDKQKGSTQSEPAAPEPRVAAPAPAASPVSAGSAEKATMIGRGISVSGDVKADSNLRVEGQIEGHNVQSAQDVEIAECGRVIANVSAKVVRIAGEVTGDISGSERVTIARSGKVQGNIVAPRVQLEDGALFRGSIDMNPAPAAESRPAAARPSPIDAGSKPPATSPQGTEAVPDSARKEPGLTLKSG